MSVDHCQGNSSNIDGVELLEDFLDNKLRELINTEEENFPPRILKKLEELHGELMSVYEKIDEEAEALEDQVKKLKDRIESLESELEDAE